jgi:hypothetical protein
MARNFSPIIENPVAYENAVKRNIIANANKTWYAKTPRASEIDEALNAGRTHNAYGNISGYVEGFIGSMAEAYDKYGKLTEKQSQAILKGIDATIARKAEWADKEAALNAALASTPRAAFNVTAPKGVVLPTKPLKVIFPVPLVRAKA